MHYVPGRIEDLDTLVAKAIAGGNPNITFDDYDRTPLIAAACMNDRLDLAEALIAVGGTMTGKNLCRVIEERADPETVRFLLAQGVPHNPFCLTAAAMQGEWEIVFILLDHGANVQEPIVHGYLPRLHDEITISILHAAAWQGEAHVVKRLLDWGALVDEHDSEGMTPLMKACHLTKKRQSNNPAAVYWLLKHGADPNAKTPAGETPLLLCLGERFPYIISRRHIAQTLLRMGADPNVESPAGTTPLMFAARNHDVNLVRALLRAGARADARTPDGRNALDIAKKYGSEDVVDFLQGKEPRGWDAYEKR